jgi:hypothetical protein
MAARTLVLVGLLLLAGCTSPVDPSALDPSTAAPTDDPAPTVRATPTSTSSPTATRPQSTARPSENPWGEEPIVVAIRNEGERSRDVEPLVSDATTFWERNGAAFLGFSVEYEVRPDAADPDLVVVVTDTVPDCGGVADAVGCAPLFTDARAIDRPATVWIEAGLSDESTTLVAKHELGHTLGLTHDDAPQAVMRAASVIYTEPQPNATERPFPWADGEFTVAVDTANASSPDAVGRQVDHALSYYEDGPPGMPDNLSFERTGAPDADVRIRFGPTPTCRSGGSCVNTAGTDPDGDGAIETYTRVEITLVDLDTEAVGWHVGYWLAHAFGAETDEQKPPPFRDASYRERRSAWWA